MVRKRRRRRRKSWLRRLRPLLLLGIVALVVWGGLYLLRRGRGRTDLYRAAVEALARGDRETAEAHLRTLLESGTQRRDVATQFMTILLESGRYEEAETYAAKWRAEPQMAMVGWRAALEIALRQLRLVEAERLAREQADLDPEYAQYTILRVRDLLGSFQGRWAAQRAAVSLATLTPSELVRARTFLFAAETLRDLVAQTDTERLRERLRASYQRAVGEALSSLVQVRDDPILAASPVVRELQARIALLSPQPHERTAAVETLETLLDAAPDRHPVRAALAAFAANQGRWGDAVAHTRKLADGPPLLWMRAVQQLVTRGRDAEALELLRQGPLRELPLVRFYEARILLRGDAAQRAEGLGLLRSLTGVERLHPTLALEVFTLLVAQDESVEGTEPLVGIVRDSGDALEQAALAEVAQRTGDAALALDLVRASAGRLESIPQGRMILALLARSEGPLLDRYLEAPIGAAEGRDGRRHFLRAAAAAAQARPEPRSPAAARLREAARADLRVLQGSDAPKADLAQAWRIALAVSDPDLAGRLAAHAIALEGPPHDIPFDLLAWAARTEDDGLRKGVAAGLRAESSGRPLEAFLRRLADLVVEHPEDPARIREAFGALAAEGAALLPSLYLQAQTAWFAGDPERGEATARRLLEASPESTEARDLLGAFLLRREAWDEVLALQDGLASGTLAAYRQLVSALLAKEEKAHARALALARRAVREHADAAESHLLLAEVLWRRGDLRRAIGALSVAPPTPAVNVLRARLLGEEGESAVAEDLLRETIAAHPHDVLPWRRLYLLLTGTGERGRLIELVTEALESPDHREASELRADLFLMRAMARLARGEEDPALRDFEEVIHIRPGDSVALNNAAWILAEAGSDRLDQALAYATRALGADPSNADIHDTVGVIHLKRALRSSGDEAQDALVQALTAADRAVAINEAAQEGAAGKAASPEEATEARLDAVKPGYRLHRAIVLDRLDRRGDAVDDLDWIVDRLPDSLAGIRAASILRTWARQGG